jgi:mono/diheme cytochrome c family protein
VAGCALSVAGALGTGAAVDPAQLPPPADRPVSFTADIQPIFEKTCLQCHGPERPRSGFRLDNRESALQGGDLGVDILPGDSAGSPLIHYVARLVEDMEMPPEGRGDPLTPDEVGLLRAWIDQGAQWDDVPAGPQFTFSVTPAVQFITVSGNAARFRQHTWMREGWDGGASEFSLKYDLDPRTHVTIAGRAIAARGDYRFDARVERDQFGWARLAYHEFHRFQDDTGGYYAPFAREAPRLGEDLVVRRRHATLEFGLELPEWPTIRLAYDLYLRDGTEATLHWGALSDGTVSRSIVPGRKRVDETTHILTLDVSYDWDGLDISNQTQFEWHDQENRRTNYEFNSPNFDFASLATDRQDYWRGANVLRLEKSVRDWLYLSGGYLYSHLEDSGGFSVESFVPSDPATPPSLDLNADDIVVRRRSHVINANAMLGPWRDLHFFAGLQAEWTRQEGFASGSTFGQRSAFDADIDRAATDENFGLRYTGLPFTVLYVETRFQQESYSQFEEGLADTQQAFLRDTDATGDLKDYEAGFSISPWQKVSLHARYRHRDRENRYDHLQDVDLFSSGNGYPAFIRARDTSSDEVEARLVIQPLRWLKTTLKYTVAATDFETATDSWEDLSQAPPVTYQGGRILAGEYDAHAISAGLVLTPWRRLHLGTTLSWSMSRSQSGVNNNQEVVPYDGQTWNLLNTATYILDEKTDLLATYLFSHADFGQGNEDYSLPLGIAYTRHAATAGVARRMKGGRVVRLEYGFFNYDEPTLGGAADYTAHALFASFRVPWP